jgi:hypothetical protein
MDLLSNTAYMGTNEDGLPLPAIRVGDGGYHVIGSLTSAPPTTQEYLGPVLGIRQKNWWGLGWSWCAQLPAT